MILIADAGSTSAKWCLIDNNEKISEFVTAGINPALMSVDDMSRRLGAELIGQLPVAPSFVTQIYYYGAGCRPGRLSDSVAEVLSSLFINAEIEVASDMLGAARGLCGHEPGIACILGTGSNSCLYDGVSIIANTPPLGYILGDEGSGAVLGRQLVGDIFKGLMPDDIRQSFCSAYNVDLSELIQRIYRKPEANRYLASFTYFIKDNIRRPEIHDLVCNSFVSFFVRNVKSYEGCDSLTVNFVGSVAYHFGDILAEAASIAGCRLGKVIQTPLDGLVEYHSK